MDENNLSFLMSQSITEECSELVSSIAEVTSLKQRGSG